MSLPINTNTAEVGSIPWLRLYWKQDQRNLKWIGRWREYYLTGRPIPKAETITKTVHDESR